MIRAASDGRELPQERLDLLIDVLIDHDERMAREQFEALGPNATAEQIEQWRESYKPPQ